MNEPNELRELDNQLYNNVPDLKSCDCIGGVKAKWPVEEYKLIRDAMRANGGSWLHWPDLEPDIPCCHAPHYTTDPASAMKVLKKCAEADHQVAIETIPSGGYMVSKLQFISTGYGQDFCTLGCTLELAICRFAKKLFSK